MNRSSITVINDKNLRGVVGPSSAVSEDMLDDMVDIIEMSGKKFVADVNRGIRAAKSGKLVGGKTLARVLGLK